MKKIKLIILKTAERALRNTAKPPKGDPPICPGILHHPTRPYPANKKNE